MKDEIKEILDFKEDADYKKISVDEIAILKDCITNLQEENKFLKLNNPEMNMEHFRIIKENKRKIDNLREENKRLKDKLNIDLEWAKRYDELFEENKKLKVELENKLTPNELVSMLNQELVKQNKNYKSRNEKAIEYIKRYESIRAYYEYQDGEYWEFNYDDDFQKELLNILQGEGKDDTNSR